MFFGLSKKQRKKENSMGSECRKKPIPWFSAAKATCWTGERAPGRWASKEHHQILYIQA